MKILTYMQLYSGWTKLASDAPQYKQRSCIPTTKSYRNNYSYVDYVAIANQKHACGPELRLKYASPKYELLL